MLETERSRPLSTTAAIALAGIAAASVFGVGVLIAERGSTPHVAATPTVTASASAPTPTASSPTASTPTASATALDPRAAEDRPSVAPTPTASAVVAAPATSAEPIAPAADSAAAPPPASLPPQLGYLTVRGREGARVYVNGADVGPANQALKVPCGLKYVRLGTVKEGARPPSWLSPGQSVAIACRAATEIDAG